MSEFQIQRLFYDLSSQAGLALMGEYLAHINLNALVDPAFPVRSGVASSAIIKSYLALLCQGKSDFDAIETHRGDAFFARALRLSAVPSSPTLRQRLNSHAAAWFDLAEDIDRTKQPVRHVYRLTERTINKHGQPLLLPEYCLEGWTTNLPARINVGRVFGLYAGHGTHEQFHSEFKSGMDLERLPSGKFNTNSLVCQLAAVAMNLLRLMGQHTLHGKNAPVRHKAQRRRIKAVMQEMIYKAGRMIRHAGRWVLGLGANDSGFAVFERHYRCLASG